VPALPELDERLGGRVVVVSPHLDDAVLSLGATLALAVEAGSRVEVLTVFSCEPSSIAPADSWDVKSGFATEGAAAKARRAEDRAACAILGVTTRWLDFGAEPYERRATPQQVLTSVAEATAAADTVLIPGYPLAHFDHVTLGNGLLMQRLNCRFLGLYAEQPYAFDRGLKFHGPVGTPPPSSFYTDGGVTSGSPNGAKGYSDAAQQRTSSGFTWHHIPVRSRHRRAKLDAIKQYRSQTRSLGLRKPLVGHVRLRLMLWYEARQGGESIAWPKAT
jgi:LmbE family N-acetylglucosaminyl deacetylase